LNAHYCELFSSGVRVRVRVRIRLVSGWLVVACAHPYVLLSVVIIYYENLAKLHSHR